MCLVAVRFHHGDAARFISCIHGFRQDPNTNRKAAMAGDERPSPREAWWQNPSIVGLLVAIVAAVPPSTTAIQGWFDSRSKLDLERSKQLNEMRQKYLDRYLSDAQSHRVLTFLRSVEDDERLKAWATQELAETEERLKSKQQLYEETIQIVAKIANQEGPLRSDSPQVVRFWDLYKVELLRIESSDVETKMVEIGRELKRLTEQSAPPSEDLKDLSFRLARLIKTELLGETMKP